MPISENIKNGKYEVNAKWPSSINHRCPNCQTRQSNEANFCSSCGTATNFELAKKERKEKINEYNKEESRMRELFKDDCLKEVGLLVHPKRNEIFNFAYDEKHGDGHSEVFYFLEELSELFK